MVNQQASQGLYDMKDLKIITYNQNHDFLLELNGTSYWISWQGVLLMDEHLVKIPEDLAMTITAELEEAEWRELAKVFMDDVWAECLAIANGDASDK